MIRQARARLAGWWRPSLTVPARPTAVERRALLVGYSSRGAGVVLVTPLGEIPIPPGCQVTVLEVQNAIAWIHNLPETFPESRRA